MKTKIVLLSLALAMAHLCAAQNLQGTWKGTLDAGFQKLQIVFHFTSQEDGKTTATMDVPAQSAMGIPVSLSYISADSVSLAVSAIQMTYQGKLKNGILGGTFCQFGTSFPLDLKPGDVSKPLRPQEPVGPLAYQTEEVTFSNRNDHVSLAGTLTYPEGYTPGKKVPVVLMVTGSGAQNRDEEVFGHRPFLVMAHYLAKHGIASLRYDDRGVGQSEGTQAGCTSADFAEDAASGLAWLKESGKFSSTGVLGHSEGGLIAFMLGAKGKADFLVSLAGPGLKGDTLLAEQQNAILRMQGAPARVTVRMCREGMAAQPKNVWLEYFMDYDPRADLDRITIPVMAINGRNDVQVLSESNLRIIRECLSGKNRKNLIKEYPGLNHLFQHCQPATAMDYYKIEETCSPEVLQDVADWINGLGR